MINFLIFRLLLLLSHLQIFLYHHQTHLHTNIFHHLNLLYHQESSDSSCHYLTLLNLQALQQSKTNPYHYLQHSYSSFSFLYSFSYISNSPSSSIIYSSSSFYYSSYSFSYYSHRTYSIFSLFISFSN